MEDLETLKVIKEKEQSINQEIDLLKQEKEKQYQQAESGFSVKLKENEEKLDLLMKDEVEKVRVKAELKAKVIMDTSQEKVNKMKLRLSDADIAKIAAQAFNSYLEGT